MKTTVIIMVTVIVSWLSAEVVINEILYDPEGADSGYEWIELYNNADTNLQLQGWQLQKAGSQFENFYTFPSYTLEAHSFLLIGENNVDEADIITNLSLQNGGSCTDGVRLLSSSGDYTDTFLYDAPNSNELPSDLFQPGQNFAPDVKAGNSLARKENGVDTDNCQEDLFECEDPTPGSANFYPIDLAVEVLQIEQNEGQLQLQLEVINLSTQPVDNYQASLEIRCNQLSTEEVTLPEISAGESYIFEQVFFVDESGYYYFTAELNYLQDSNLENNISTASLIFQSSPIIINEVMFDPSENEPEWLELYVRDGCEYNVDNLRIIDAAEREIEFRGNIYDYAVVSENKAELLSIYNSLDSSKVIQANTWTTLNNGEENLVIKDDCQTILDSMFYEGSGETEGNSLERVNPYSDEEIQWLPSLAELGATPAAANSVLPAASDLTICSASIQLQNQQLQHSILLKNIGLNLINNAELNCFLAQNAAAFQLLEEFNLEIEDSLQFTFNSNLPNEGYYVFKYQVNSVQDVVPENDTAYSFYNQNALPIVVNEIMFDPFPEEPEWIELKQNYIIEDWDSLLVVCNQDSFWVQPAADEYMIVTSDSLAVNWLQNQYGSNLCIFTGVPNLANNGETITLYDQQLNLLDSLSYTDSWNYGKKGVSAERVNSTLTATADNWGPCVNEFGNTIGVQNSIFTQSFTSQAKLEVKPNPFCPAEGERTIIYYDLPEKISQVTMRIFDLKGRLIRVVKDQDLVAARGEIVWDGRNKEGKIISVGLYIILFEATGLENEKVYSKTKTITIAK
jgi:hypothetical protein